MRATMGIHVCSYRDPVRSFEEIIPVPPFPSPGEYAEGGEMGARPWHIADF